MARFEIREREEISGRIRYAVVDTEWRDLPVANFSSREDAEAHADRLNHGPLDLEEQEAWKDEWEEEDEQW